jgi:ssRNA-specific RNase YbeY (16S rRNA maturation enzyme)
LHLLQYDHQDIKGYKKMVFLQNKIMQELKIK